jgi:hypothetical protein
MTTSTYLNSVLNILPAVQARNIVDLLNEFQAKGEIKDADEYKAKLEELATAVNDTDPKPSFEHIRGLIWHFTSADAHTMMMRAAQQDLFALFQQASEMGAKVDDHHFLILKNLAADMERGLADQENTIRRLEWLANTSNEFSMALVNAFVSASLYKVPRSQTGAKNLYFDNRTYQSRTEAELPSAVVSEHGQRLILDATNAPQVLPISVQMLTDSSSYGTQIQTDIDNNILNLVDGTRGTFWTRHVYLSETVPKVSTVLEFNLGVGKDINYMIIEGAAELVFKIESIYGIAPDGHKIALLTSETEINGRQRIDFARTLVKGIQVTFSTNSYVKADYITDPKAAIFEYFDPSMAYEDVDLIEAFGPLAAEVLTSSNLVDALNVPSGTSTFIDTYMYPFALDNVWFGNSLYEDSGIFVSTPLKGNNLGVCAVQTRGTTSTTESVSNSIEFEIIKQDVTPKFTETKFPIPYLGQTTVTSERLILTKREQDSTMADAGALRFCPYVDSSWVFGTTDPVRVYKNGEELQIGTDFYIAIKKTTNNNGLLWVDSWTASLSDTRVFSNYTLSPAKMWIRLVSPDSTAVYTVDYTIRTSDTYIDDDTMWLDTNKTVFLSDEGKVYFKRQNPDVTIESKLYLQITLRRNTASQSSTPELYEYALLGASYYS